MKMIRNRIHHRLFIFFLAVNISFTFIQNLPAQNTKGYKVCGKIVNADNNEPLEMATIVIPKTSLWAMSDMKGKFTFPSLKPGKYKYEVSYVGFNKLTGDLEVKGNKDSIIIKMVPLSLGLKEVVVTAQEQKMGSAAKIDKSAIQHIQPKSVEDLLQLIPGNLTKNPGLNDIGQAYIREISSNANNALGTAIMVDGAPLSNDANMQAFSTAQGGTSLDKGQSVSGKGTDLRSISPDNIESVEVVRGIPSVEYGNLTSGLLIIKTKSGATPFEAKAKVDPFSKMVYAGKGFNLGSNAGAVNLSADYSQSYSDIRKKFNGFDRITANAGYTNTFMSDWKPLTLDVKFSYYTNVNSVKSDPQLLVNEKIKNDNTGFRLNIEGNWALNTKVITNLSYSLKAEYSHQKDFRRENVALANGIAPISNSYISGEYATGFLKSSYYSEYTLDGKPLDLFGQIKANRMFQFGNDSYSNVRAGLEWRFTDNNGNGLIYDMNTPPSSVGSISTRPRSYKSIPGLNNMAFFVEDKTNVNIGSTSLTAQAGVRFSNMFLDKSVNHDNIFTVEPRINIDYQFLNHKNNSVFDDLSIVGGFGIAAKAPVMIYLYPDNAYLDNISCNYYNTNDPSKSLVVMTTKVIDDTSNPDLKPAYSRKAEVGLAGRIGKMSGNVTFFYEKHTNEFGFNSTPATMPFNKYTIPQEAVSSSYENGKVWYTDASNNRFEAPVSQDTALYTYNTPKNNIETIKKGVEYNFNLGQIPVIRTSVVVDGAWFYIKRKSSQESYSLVNASVGGNRFPYLSIMPAGSGSISQRINTNIRFITHIPQLKLIFSTTAQIVWMESLQRIYEDKNGNDLTYTLTDKNNLQNAAVNPVGYYDKKGNVYPWQAGLENQSLYGNMIQRQSYPNYYDKESYPPSVILNFRLTKEIGKIMQLSFMANNFLKLTKTYKYKTTAGYKELCIPMYFGAELTIKI